MSESGSEGTESPSDDHQVSGQEKHKPVPSTSVADKPKRGFLKIFLSGVGTVIALGIAFAYHVKEQNPSPVIDPNNPEGFERTVVPLGCELNEFREYEDRECAINSGLDPDPKPAEESPNAAPYPRTYVEPLPEGESGRVGYNRVNTQAQATPTDIGLSLTLK